MGIGHKANNTSMEKDSDKRKMLVTEVGGDFALLSLGSNLGDRIKYLRMAIDSLGTILRDMRISKVYETEPWGVDQQPDYLNCAVAGHLHLDPDALMDKILWIEQTLGRQRLKIPKWSSRTIDIDIIIMGQQNFKSSRLAIPHPLFRERRFVLQPLNDICPNCIDPVTRMTIRDLMICCTDNIPVKTHHEQI